MSDNSSSKCRRKTKLVPRSFDEHDSNNSSESKLESELQHNDTRPSLKFSVDVEIEEFDNENLDREFAELFNQSSLKTEITDEESDLEHYFSFVTKKNSDSIIKRNNELDSKPEEIEKPKPKETLKHYTFTDQEVMKELEILTKSDNIADKMIEAEIRNNIFRLSNVKFVIPSLHQKVFAFLEIVSTSKLILKSHLSRLALPVSYKCYICKKAWWHLYEFLNDCDSHTEPYTNVQIEKFSETLCNLVLYDSNINVQFEVFPIEGNCWRCNKNSKSHFKKNFNMCKACGEKLGHCFNLKMHEGTCDLYIKQKCSNMNCYSCPVCDLKCWGMNDFGKHMMFYHDVRSDLYAHIQHKECDFCFGIKFKDHFCKRWKLSKKCNFCMRSFQHQGQVSMHQQFTNQSWTCPICFEYCQHMCCNVNHMLQHTKNYTKLFKCLVCLRMFRSLKDYQDHKLLFHYVNRNLVVSQKIYVPVKCAKACSIHDEPNDKQLKILDVVGGVSTSDTEPSTSGLQNKKVEISNLDSKTDQVDDFVDDEFVDETAAIDEIISKREKKSNTVVVEATEELKDEIDAIDETITPGCGTSSRSSEVNHVNIKQEISEDLNDQIEQKHDISLLKQEIEIVENQLQKQETNAIVVLDSDDEVEVKKEPSDDSEVAHENLNEFPILNIKTEQDDAVYDHAQNNDINTVVVKKEPADENDADTQDADTRDADTQDADTQDADTQDAIDFDKHELGTELDSANEPSSDEKTDYMKLLLQPSTSAQEIKKEDIDIDTDDDDKLVIDSEDSSSGEEFKPKRRRRIYKSYICPNCGEQQTSSLELRWHVANCDSMKSVYTCKICTEPFRTFSKYCKHLPDHDLDELMCPECGRQFEHLVKLCIHIDRHVKQLFCRTTILDKKNHEKTMYGCRKCHKKFISRANFDHWQDHLTIYDPKTVKFNHIVQYEGPHSPDSTKDGICSDSDKNGYPSIGLSKTDLDECIRRLILPTNKNTLSKIGTCSICERKFDRIQVSKRHIVEHMLRDAYSKIPAVGGFQCQICSSTFNQADQFKLHMRIHGSLHVYKCEICDKNFSDSSNFTKHKKVHGSNFINCDKCPKKFQSTIRYDLHMEEHKAIGEKGLRCELCDLTFATRCLLKRHCRFKHKEKSYSCKVCRQPFPSLKFKWDHEWVVHKLRRGVIDCNKCDASFRRFVDLKKHCLELHDVTIGKKVFLIPKSDENNSS